MFRATKKLQHMVTKAGLPTRSDLCHSMDIPFLHFVSPTGALDCGCLVVTCHAYRRNTVGCGMFIALK